MIRKWFEFRSISSISLCMRDKKAKNMLCLTLKYGWIATKKFIGFIWKILNKSLAIGSADCTCSIFLHVEIGKLKHCGPIFYLFIRIFAQTHKHTFYQWRTEQQRKKFMNFPIVQNLGFFRLIGHQFIGFFPSAVVVYIYSLFLILFRTHLREYIIK